MSIWNCQACGAKLPEGSRFCTNCGKEVVSPPHLEKPVQDALVLPFVSEFTRIFPSCPICGSGLGYDATRKLLTYYVRCRSCGAVWQPSGGLRGMNRLLLVEPDKDMRASSLVRKSDRWHEGYGYKLEFWKSLDLGMAKAEQEPKGSVEHPPLKKELPQAQPPAGEVPRGEARSFKIRTPFWPLFLKVILPILIIIVAGIGTLRPEFFAKFLPEVKLLPVESSDQYAVSVHYAWKPVGGLSRYSWDVAIPRKVYQYYKNKPRVYFLTEKHEYGTHPYLVYITDPEDDYLLKAMVVSIDNVVAKKGLSEEERLYMSVAFAQSILYKLDIESTGYKEYPRYPVETLVDEVGDCEDHAILLGALFKEMGYDVALIFFPETSAHEAHVGLGVAEGRGLTFDGIYYSKDGKKYYYVETAGGSFFKIGVPTEFADAPPYVLPVVP